MASEQYSYVLTETAEADIEAAFDYKLSNPEAASPFADELAEKLEEPCRAPKSGRPVQNPYLKRDGVRRVLVKNYIAYYLIDDAGMKIVVLRVVYNRRDQDLILKSV